MKIKLLGANQEYDTDEQAVRHRQLVTYVGAGLVTATYVVSDMTYGQEHGFMYTLINTASFETRKTDMIRKESLRFGIGYYRPDEHVELMPEDQFQSVCRKASEQSERKTEDRTGKPWFYTENGHQGSRYDRNLSTKDITLQIREYCKKQYPDYKFSVRSKYFAGGSEVNVTLLSGEHEVMSESGKTHGYIQTMGVVSGDMYQTELTPEGHDMLVDISAYAKSYNRSDSDGMQDYFDETFYFRLEVGDWDKPYTVIPKKEHAATPKMANTTAQDFNQNSGLRVIDYSDKTIAVVGDTKPVKDTLKDLGGRFNPRLQIDGASIPGWVFPKTKEAQLQNLLTQNQPDKAAVPMKTNILKLVEQKLTKATEPKIPAEKTEQGLLF